MPSAVTTRLADVFDPRLAGTCTLICPSPAYSTVAADPSNVTATVLPARCDPMMVASEPATSGVTANVAAFTARLTVTVAAGVTGGGGGGGTTGAAATFNVSGID